VREYPNVRFLVGGAGEQEGFLKELAGSLNIKGIVRFIGAIPHEDLPKYLATSDIYVSTSLSDMLSVSLLEAMSCNLPAIVTDIKGNREIIKDGENGFLFPKSDPEKLAERIIYLLKNEEIRKKFGEKNRKLVIEKYDWNKGAREIEKIYERLLKERK